MIDALRKYFLFLFFVSQTALYSQVLGTKPYSFDLGTSNSYVSEISTQLSQGDIYSNERGYGFTSQVSNSFERPNLFLKILGMNLLMMGFVINKLHLKLIFLKENGGLHSGWKLDLKMYLLQKSL